MESGFYVVIGVFIGGLFSYLSAQRAGHVASLERELARIKRSHNSACQQVKAYYQLESRYASEVSAMMDQPRQTVQNRFRDDVEQEFGIRPTWTARDVEKEIADL